jgi:hypothetical protein
MTEPWPHRIGYKNKNYVFIGGELHYAKKSKHKTKKVAFYEPLSTFQLISYYFKGLLYYFKNKHSQNVSKDGTQ